MSTSYYLFNAHGDVTGLTNGAQAVTKSYDYDAFGNEKNPSATDDNPFRYCGEYFDKETGTYYLRARYYDPSIGRFTQQDAHWNTANMIYGDNPNKINEREDALGLKAYTYTPSIGSIMQSGNLYVYGMNNPIYYWDFSGSFACTVTGALAGGIVAAFNVWTDSSKDNADFWSYVAAGAACGAIAGVAADLAVATGGVGAFAGAAIVGGLANAGNTIADGLISSRRTGTACDYNIEELAVAFGVGALSNMLTFGLAKGTFAIRGGNVFYNMIDDGIGTFTDGMTKVVSPTRVTKYKQIPKFLNMFFESSSDGVVVIRGGTLASVTCVLSNVATEIANSLIVAGSGNIYARYTSSIR